MVTTNAFFMFIKGTPEQPKCKFTRKLLELLAPQSYRFRTFDILNDERIRQWLKFYSSWPTFPQIFLNGKFVGGVDIVSELIEAGEFDSMVPEKARKPVPEVEARELLAQHKVLVLIEGTTDNPTSPESKDLVALLHRNGVKFIALDLA
jgi:Grx4 family monothiol glutaredoxin